MILVCFHLKRVGNSAVWITRITKFDFFFLILYISVIYPPVSSSKQSLNHLTFYAKREGGKVVAPSGLHRYKHLSEKFPSFQKRVNLV